MEWLLIGFFFLFAGLLTVAEQADKDDYKSGKQKKVVQSSGPYKWTKEGKNVATVVFTFLVLFVIIILLIGG